MKLIVYIRFLILFISLATFKSLEGRECLKDFSNYLKEKVYFPNIYEVNCQRTLKQKNNNPLIIWADCSCEFMRNYYYNDQSLIRREKKIKSFELYFEDYYYSEVGGYQSGKSLFLASRNEKERIEHEEDIERKIIEKARFKKWIVIFNEEKENIMNKAWNEFTRIRNEKHYAAFKHDKILMKSVIRF